jgi:methyltransferase
MADLDTRWIYTLVILLVVVQRLAELALAKRNAAKLLARGGIEVGETHYPWMVLLHAGFLISCLAEVWLFDRPFVPALAIVAATLLILATAVRFMTIRTLGDRWTTRVIYVPGERVITEGPFRFFRHPNYAAVMIETMALPLLHTAWVTALTFTLLNAWLIATRIRVEEAALAAHTDYRVAFGLGDGE